MVKANGAFVITCTISLTPGPPTPSPFIHKSLAPKDLLESVGQLLDDPLYSDIELNRWLNRADYIGSSMFLQVHLSSI